VEYLDIESLLHLVPEAAKMKHLLDWADVKKAKGSNHNHQTWEGGYLDHVVETMNIAVWLYRTSPRKLPFTLADALLVLFLHDLEKPFKNTATWKNKEDRRAFRDKLIQQNQIALTDLQKNALEYVEGEHDYSNTERKMKELAAFCHCCDIFSARLWHGEGKSGW
jgi:hypothetical protein